MHGKFIFIWLLSILLISSCGVKRSLEARPDVRKIQPADTSRVKHSETHFSLGKNSFYKNKYGIWELYLEGDAFERGLANGSLSRELIWQQETAFMQNLESRVPSDSYRNFLKKMISLFNRKMHLHVSEEYKKEIYGVSRYAQEDYSDFAPAYIRMLYLHGAHDIGHALKDLMLVGCTSFAAWGEKTRDGDLLIGRNFDFYVGDDFSDQKIAAFINPAAGHKFMMYTWGGMIGVVSGMNEKGISVSINAGRSRIPMLAKTPISLVAREVLQYAGNTQEAIEIAKKREVFVSEAILVGSATENKAILIEVAPKKFGVHEVENSNQLICSNHFQSETYQDDRRNQKARNESHSLYRYERMQELLAQKEKLDVKQAVAILRDQEGLNDSKLGYGNEKAINQLLAHHGIIFKPGENMVWVSANPYQMGEFVAYDLERAFREFENGNVMASVARDELVIPSSPFLKTRSYSNYEKYRKLENEVKLELSKNNNIAREELQWLIELNPHFWEAWYLAGMAYYQKKDYRNAIIHFKQAAKREVTTIPDKVQLEKMIRKSYRKL